MKQDRPLTAMEWLEKYYYNQKNYKENPEAKAAFFRMSKKERSKLGGVMILDSVLKRKEIEAENKRNGTYTAQDTIDRLQDEVAFLYFQRTKLQQFVITLREALSKYEENIAPEEMDEIRGEMIYLLRLGEMTHQSIEKHWTLASRSQESAQSIPRCGSD